jgi:dTDP-L-rhamnose 4-epimerase
MLHLRSIVVSCGISDSAGGVKRKGSMRRKEKILVSGGAGFIGRHVTAQLQQDGHWVRWLDNLDPQVHGPNAIRDRAYCRQADDMRLGDVRVRAEWLRALQGVDSVFHLAAQTGTGQSMYQVARYTDVNVGGTAILWDILANQSTGVKKVVVASSRSVYGEGAYRCLSRCGLVVPEPRSKMDLQQGRWEARCPECGSSAQALATPETSPPQPASLYACTKLAQEQMSLAMGKALNISTSILRFQNVFGPGQSMQNPYTGIISIFSNQMRQNLPITVYEDGEESRDFVFAEDVARACAWVLRANLPQTILNVGSGQATKVIELARMLKRYWKSTSPIVISGDFRVGDIRHNWADTARLKRAWPNWKPISLGRGLAKYVRWAQTQPVCADRSHAAMRELKKRNL